MKKLFAMLLALCMMCGVVCAGAEEATQKVECWLDYQVSAGMTEIVRLENEIFAEVILGCEQYTVDIMTVDIGGLIYKQYEEWSEELMDEVFSGMCPREVTAMYLMLSTFMHSSLAMGHAESAEKLDTVMADGKPLMAYRDSNYVLCSHYNDGVGFLVEVRPQAGMTITEEEMLQIAEKVSLSYQPPVEQLEESNKIITTGAGEFKREPYPSGGNGAFEMNETFTCIGEHGIWYIIRRFDFNEYIHKGLAEIYTP